MYGPRAAKGWLFVGMTVALLSSLALGLATVHDSAPVHVVSFGVNMHPLQDNYDVYPPTQTLRLASEIGASVVRIDIHWGWIQYLRSGRESWDAQQVQHLDRFVAEAARRHIQVMATVLDTPCWASNEAAGQCSPPSAQYRGTHPPSNPQDYAHFLTRLIRHEGRRIRYYEIWNEPNLPRFWKHPDPVFYTKLLRAAYRAIKAQDPRAQVLAGALSGADVNFVNRMYESGAKGYFDALSLHPYTGDRSPDTCSVASKSFACGLVAVHRIMLRYGDQRPIWLTEFGVSVSEHESATAQARYLMRAASLVKGWSYVQGAIWYELYDDPTGHDGQHYGLFGGSLLPRPGATAFKLLAKEDNT